jgi:hypothetical protein
MAHGARGARTARRPGRGLRLRRGLVVGRRRRGLGAEIRGHRDNVLIDAFMPRILVVRCVSCDSWSPVPDNEKNEGVALGFPGRHPDRNRQDRAVLIRLRSGCGAKCSEARRNRRSLSRRSGPKNRPRPAIASARSVCVQSHKTRSVIHRAALPRDGASCRSHQATAHSHHAPSRGHHAPRARDGATERPDHATFVRDGASFARDHATERRDHATERRDHATERGDHATEDSSGTWER